MALFTIIIISPIFHRIDHRELSPWLSLYRHKLTILVHSILISTCTPLISLGEVFVAWETCKAISLLVKSQADASFVSFAIQLVPLSDWSSQDGTLIVN